MKRTAYSTLLFLLIAGAFLAGSWYSQRGTVEPATAGARKVLYYVDPMHPAYKSDKPGVAPDCGMQLEPVYADGGPATPGAESRPSSLAPGTVHISPERQQLVGVRVSPVEKASGTHALRILGRVAPDEKRLYRLKAPVDGWIREVSPVTTGSHVEKDQLLAAFSATDLFVSAQGLILALTSMDRLAKNSPESSAQTNPTNSNFQQRIERLQSLGMSPIQIEEIRRTRDIPQGIKIFAPTAGFVLARNVSPDERFEKGAELYRIADLSRVWILADLFQNEARYLRAGARAQVSVPDQARTFPARVAEALPQFDPATRTLKVRLEVDNPGFVLRPDMFVDVELPISHPPAIAVPVDAVLDSGAKKTVFVDRGNGHFEPRPVEIGWRLGERVGIVKGLTPGERVVTSGTFLIDSESRMKAAAAGFSGETSTDPICGMAVDVSKARAAGRTSEYRGKTYYFCTDDCKQTFDKDPASYVAKATGREKQPVSAGHGENAHGAHAHGGHH